MRERRLCASLARSICLVATWLLCHVTNHGTTLFPSHRLKKKAMKITLPPRRKRFVKNEVSWNTTISKFCGSHEKLLQATSIVPWQCCNKSCCSRTRSIGSDVYLVLASPCPWIPDACWAGRPSSRPRRRFPVVVSLAVPLPLPLP